jgi:phosphoserine phosphatase RsbU/P
MNDQTRYLKNEVARLQDENRALKEEVISLRHYLNSLTALMEAIDEIDPNAEIMPLLDRILYNAVAVLGAEAGSLLVVDDETQDLVFVLAHGRIPRESLAGVLVPTGKGIAGWVAAHRQATIVNNAPTDDRFYNTIDNQLQFSTNSILAVPIIGNGNVLGVIEVLNKRDGAPFGKTDQMLLSLLCRFAGEVLSEIMMRQDREANQPQTAQASTEAPPA